jgi:cyanosortase A-associated protein
MSYVNHPHPNEKRFRQYDPSLSTPDEPGAIIRHQKETGFYSLSIEKERVYLRACINPRGPSAITYAQFIHNRYTYDLQFARLLPVLLGQESLRDHRCLWTHLSIPVKNASFEADYQVLEKVWLSWYQWWHPRFPKR